MMRCCLQPWAWGGVVSLLSVWQATPSTNCWWTHHSGQEILLSQNTSSTLCPSFVWEKEKQKVCKGKRRGTRFYLRSQFNRLKDRNAQLLLLCIIQKRTKNDFMHIEGNAWAGWAVFNERDECWAELWHGQEDLWRTELCKEQILSL